jgi:hypothetical protein
VRLPCRSGLPSMGMARMPLPGREGRIEGMGRSIDPTAFATRNRRREQPSARSPGQADKAGRGIGGQP